MFQQIVGARWRFHFHWTIKWTHGARDTGYNEQLFILFSPLPHILFVHLSAFGCFSLSVFIYALSILTEKIILSQYILILLFYLLQSFLKATSHLARHKRRYHTFCEQNFLWQGHYIFTSPEFDWWIVIQKFLIDEHSPEKRRCTHEKKWIYMNTSIFEPNTFNKKLNEKKNKHNITFVF